jgi:hypothetical protein
MKQKLTQLLILFCSLSVWQVKAQSKLDCNNSKLVNTNYLQFNTDSNSVAWYSFIADSTAIAIEGTSINGNRIKKIELWTGDCMSMKLIATDTMLNNSDLEVTIFSWY